MSEQSDRRGARSSRTVTIGHISRALGISTSTISRALSGRGYVAADVKERITVAAREMGYLPDLTARNLRSGSSNKLGLIVTNLVDPFYARLAAGFQEVARASGYEVTLILDQGDAAEELAAVETHISAGVSGIALTPVSARAVARSAYYFVPIVQMDRLVSEEHALVSGDNRFGGRIATEHLLQKGHRRIAFVIDHTRWTTGSERLAGWRRAYTDRGLEPPEDLVFALVEDGGDIAQRCGAALDEMRRKGATAVFAASSVVAQELYLRMLDTGLSAPRDISLVAYDDMQWTHMVRPGITVVFQHVEEMGRQAAEALLRAVRAEGQQVPRTHSLIQPTLVQRGSVAPLGEG